MVLAVWIRERLWRADAWVTALAELRGAATGNPARLFELAHATELCDPDPRHALDLFVDAWRLGNTEAIARVKELATTLEAHGLLAELAATTGDHVGHGAALIDAGLLEAAVSPLKRGLDGATGVLTRDDVQTLITLATRATLDAPAAIASCLERAATSREPSRLYLHAARIARVAAPDRLPVILSAAMRVCPDDADVAAVVERSLLDKGDPDALLAHYRARFERASTRALYVDRVRAAGMAMLGREAHRGLGLRLVHMSLKHAYEAKCGEIRSHIAAWEIIVTHARSQRSTLDLVPLLVEALASTPSPDVSVYLARLGLEIAWRDASDTLAAQPYAATLLDFVPEHPLATEFAKELPPEPAPEPPPEELKITFAKPKPVRKISGRLALLTPPPSRTTTLKRDTSPFPTPPAPATHQDRAPRTVVPIDVRVELPSGGWFSTLIRDVSATGAFMLTKRSIEVGTLISLELRLPTSDAIAQDSYHTNAHVVRRTEVGWGLSFVDISPRLLAAIRAMTA